MIKRTRGFTPIGVKLSNKKLFRPFRAKARIGVGLRPSLKAGVNERQFVDDAVVLVSRYFGHYSAFRPGFVMDIWAYRKFKVVERSDCFVMGEVALRPTSKKQPKV
ncbi:MAG TPA: hypothetical protein VJ440_03120 [Candidatus Brocadiaceae bacterium]|nr:hypothetical protein [Candidatus Brocadiaceae bacterium]